jgi:hypothetical protein
MSDTAVAAIAMSFSAALASSGDFSSGSVGTSVAAGNTAVVTAPAGDTGNLIFTFYNASGGATVTFEPGDEPPSELSGVPTSSSGALTLTADKPYFVVVQPGNWVQSNGTIRITVATNTTIVGCYRVPQGY